MLNKPPLSPSRRGAWIINTAKHVTGVYDTSDPALAPVDNLLFAGKCGHLLIVLTADRTEQLPSEKVLAHARFCGIAGPLVDPYLNALRDSGCLDWDDGHTTYEVLALSRQRVLATTSRIFLSRPLGAIEETLLSLLEFCLRRPRLESELRAHLSSVLTEHDAIHLLQVVSSLGLLGTVPGDGHGEALFYNEYQFGDRAPSIRGELSTLPQRDREQLDMLVDEVATRPGILLESAPGSDRVKQLALAMGMVEASMVSSQGGHAVFLTSPRFSPPSVGREADHLEDDVFHHAKMLLSSLRFGELRSSPGRGRILDPHVLVTRLIEREAVGPCTAIGQDYGVLEREGVVRTIPAPNRPGEQFFMQLRRHEPADLVLGLLSSGTDAAVNTRALPRALELPLEYAGPEAARPEAARRAKADDVRAMRLLLEAIRT